MKWAWDGKEAWNQDNWSRYSFTSLCCCFRCSAGKRLRVTLRASEACSTALKCFINHQKKLLPRFPLSHCTWLRNHRESSYLWVYDGQRIDPHSPTAILMFYGVMQQHPEQRIHHVGDFLLLGILRVDVSHGDEPFLPHGHLQYGPTVLAIVITQQRHIWQEELFHLQQLFGLLRLSNECGDDFKYHCGENIYCLLMTFYSRFNPYSWGLCVFVMCLRRCLLS